MGCIHDTSTTVRNRNQCLIENKFMGWAIEVGGCWNLWQVCCGEDVWGGGTWAKGELENIKAAVHFVQQNSVYIYIQRIGST